MTVFPGPADGRCAQAQLYSACRGARQALPVFPHCQGPARLAGRYEREGDAAAFRRHRQHRWPAISWRRAAWSCRLCISMRIHFTSETGPRIRSSSWPAWSVTIPGPPHPCNIVHFTDIQLQLRDHCPSDMMTIVMRRMMMRIARELALMNGCKALITGVRASVRWPARRSKG